MITVARSASIGKSPNDDAREIISKVQNFSRFFKNMITEQKDGSAAGIDKVINAEGMIEVAEQSGMDHGENQEVAGGTLGDELDDRTEGLMIKTMETTTSG